MKIKNLSKRIWTYPVLCARYIRSLRNGTWLSRSDVILCKPIKIRLNQKCRQWFNTYPLSHTRWSQCFIDQATKPDWLVFFKNIHSFHNAVISLKMSSALKWLVWILRSGYSLYLSYLQRSPPSVGVDCFELVARSRPNQWWIGAVKFRKRLRICLVV